MTQADPELKREGAIGLHGFGTTIREAGTATVRPVISVYNTGKSAVGTVVEWEVLRNLSGVVGVALGLRDGARSATLEGRPAKIDLFDGQDPWERQN